MSATAMDKLDAARSMLPVTEHCTYLNTASVGPVTRIYAEILASRGELDLRQGRARAERFAALIAMRETLRTEIAALLHCDPRQVFLTRSTGGGLEQIIDAMPLVAGDEIVSTAIEHEACAAPLRRRAEECSVALRLLPRASDNGALVDALAALVTPKTRLVVVSAVAFETGQLLPLAEIAALARENGIRTLVDGAQCAGAAPLDPDALGVDFCAIPLQKWLMGPEGLGALYVRDPEAHALERAPRDEVIHGLGVLEATAASLAWMRETLGWDWIFERTGTLARHARRAVLAHDGEALLTPESFAGITSFRAAAATRRDAGEGLARQGFIVRHLPELGAFRLATAFFNTEAEIDATLAAIFTAPSA